MTDTEGATGGATGPTPKTPGPARRKPGRDEKRLRKLIFRQDLNEVHLLIDFISGRADRSLTTLAMPDPTQPSRMMGSGEIVQRLTQMRYPPDDNDVVTSQNAAILLMAKDRLSALAAPARGLTIAYTAMFIDAETKSLCSRLRDWRRNRSERKRQGQQAKSKTGDNKECSCDETDPSYDTRIDLAETTFPALQRHAQLFRRWRQVLMLLSLGWLLLTALTYWDVGLGRSVLDRLDQNWKARGAILQDYPEFTPAFNPGKTDIPACDINGLRSKATGSAADTATNETNRKLFACRRLNELAVSQKRTEAELQRVFGCEEMGPISTTPPVMTTAAHAWCWRWLMPGSVALLNKAIFDAFTPKSLETALRGADAPADSHADKDTDYVQIDWQTATAILSVYTSYVLPMMFALLGTLIGSFPGDPEQNPRQRTGAARFGTDAVGYPGRAGGGYCRRAVPQPVLGPSGGRRHGRRPVDPHRERALGFLAGYASQNFFHLSRERGRNGVSGRKWRSRRKRWIARAQPSARPCDFGLGLQERRARPTAAARPVRPALMAADPRRQPALPEADSRPKSGQAAL